MGKPNPVEQAIQFTATQSRLMAILNDGQAHTKEELHTAIEGNGGIVIPGARSSLAAHICMIRKLIRPFGRDILCVVNLKRYWYQQVRIFRPDDS